MLQIEDIEIEQEYLSKSVLTLKEFKTLPEFKQVNPDINIDNFQSYCDLLLEDSKVGFLFRNGFCRLPNCKVIVASTIDDVGQVNGEMLDWWFCQVDNTDRYKIWHPIDHIHGTWNDEYLEIDRKDRRKQHYINHTHIVQEKINGSLQKLRISFVSPSNFFDVSKFSKLNITACICAKINIYDPPFGYVRIGYLIHMIRVTNENRNELVSRFWLGDVDKSNENYNCIGSRIVNCFGNTSAFRYIRITNSLVNGLFKHCQEEMNCLKEFLPHFYLSNHLIQSN